MIIPLIPYLGASPDGIVCDEGGVGILEVKCPFSMRNSTIKDACENPKFFLDDQGNLKRTHEHWYQVQTQLLVSGASFCEFVVYTHKDLHIERIAPHEPTMKLIMDKTSELYINHIRPFLDNSSN